MRIPGLNFLLRFLLPNCFGIALVLASAFLVFIGISYAIRYLLDAHGIAMRDHMKWFFQPKNFFFFLPGVVALGVTALILFMLR